MSLVLAGIAPHPPLLIPEIGQGELVKVRRTRDALQELSRQVAAARPETVIIITPHGPVLRDTPVIMAGEELKGDFAYFNAATVKLRARIDGELAGAIALAARAGGIGVLLQNGAGEALDHGVSVPLYYLQEAGTGRQCLAIAFAFLSYRELFRFGEAVQEAVRTTGRRTVIVASGDLSHRLIPGAPSGYNPRGREFDEQLVEHLRHYRVEEILSMDEKLVAAAGECGLRSFAVMLGCLSGFSVRPQVLSYEGPFGVGYLVALFTPQAGGDGNEQH
ncbi:MAG: AmmeMemoRadiSam system protein B [Bacillota bacterium]